MPASAEPQLPLGAADEPSAVTVVDALYADGVARPLQPLDLPAGTPVRLVVPLPVPPAASSDVEARGDWRTSVLAARKRLARIGRLDLLLIAASLLLYAITRFTALSAFPIYFFCDEAIQVNLARALLDNGLRSSDGVLLPPFFKNDQIWSLSASVYVHLVSLSLFGASVEATRATSAFISLLGSLAVALTLRLIFANRFWWAGLALLAVTPAWFLHSRTAFETVLMVSFYAMFLCCYLLYRYRAPNYIFPALAFGALTFYSYVNGQGVMLVSGLLLLLFDLPYHIRQGMRFASTVCGFALVLAIPYVRFRLLHPDAVSSHFVRLQSYWLQPLPLAEKLQMFASAYAVGLDPGYWFLPNTVDFERHRILHAGHLPLAALPFVLVGLGLCLYRWRSPAHRTVLVAVLATPFAAALVAVGITRALAMVVPFALLFCLGFEAVWQRYQRYLPYPLVALALALIFSVSGLGLLRAALVDGPTWFTDYGLSGMQYGARQLFLDAIPAALKRSPNSRILVSPTWANNPNSFAEYFLTPAQRQQVEFANIDAFAFNKRELNQQQLFIMPDYEYQRALANPKFVLQAPEFVVAYPDGKPGFFFVRMQYAANIDELFAADRAARARLVTSQTLVDGQQVMINHSRLDMGTVDNLFDGDPNVLLRGEEANPFVLELVFATPRRLAGFALTIGSMDAELKVTATPVEGAASSATQAYTGLPFDPTIEYLLPDGPQVLRTLRIEVRQLNAPEISHIHIRELVLR